MASGGFHDSYTIGSQLGSGAFSVVNEATPVGGGNKVAVKVIRLARLTDSDRDALQEEIKILKEVHHPHVLQLKETFHEDEFCFLITDLVEGGELFDRITEKETYTELEARDLVFILIDTLAYLHGHGVVHRDIKPENLLLVGSESDTNIKIADFGFAKHIPDLAGDQNICGTPDYIAPEILAREPYGPGVDVWSAGVIVYILLGGYPPFYDEDDAKLFAQIKKGKFKFHSPFFDPVSDDAKDLITKMLTRDPAKRPSAQDLLEHPWLTSKTVGANDISGAVAQLRKWNARRKFRGGVKAILAVNRFANAFGKGGGVGTAPGGGASEPDASPSQASVSRSRSPWGTDEDMVKPPPVPASEAAESEQFSDNYDMGKKLGSGAFSVVRRAVAKPGGGEYAVKVIRKARLTPEDVAALEDEVAILSTIDHPNVLQLLEVYNEPEYYYLVTELVQGGELFDRITQKTAYDEADARMLLKTLLESVQFLHERGVVHRDLKPENLLLASADDDTNIKIADFGFAKHTQDLASERAICGTADYIAPEILSHRKYGPAVDIWSSGVIAYILLGGYPPFYSDDETELFKIIQSGVFEFHSPFWDHVSGAAQDLIRQMLIVDPQQRPGASELLGHEFFASDAKEDLSNTLKKMKAWNARRKLKGGVAAIIATNRMASLIGKK